MFINPRADGTGRNPVAYGKNRRNYKNIARVGMHLNTI
jgi:hypothetical protein